MIGTLGRISVLLGGVVLTFGCHRDSTDQVHVSRQLARYVPESATALAGMDLASFRSSAFFERHASQLDVPLLQGARERIGVDPVRDVWQMLVTWMRNAPVVIAQGKFDSDAVEQKLRASGAVITHDKGEELFGSGGSTMMFPARDLVLVGEPAALVSLSEHGGLGDSLKHQLRSVPVGSQFWMVSSEGFPLSALPLSHNVSSALANVTRFIAAAVLDVRFDTGAHVRGDFKCLSDDDAQQVNDAVRAGIGMARLMTKDNSRGFVQLYDTIQVQRNGANVHVAADLSAAQTDLLLQESGLIPR